MTTPSPSSTNLTTVGAIVAAMAVVALLEAVIPLHARGRRHREHLWPNLALTGITFATNLLLNTGLLLVLQQVEARNLGLLRWASLDDLTATIVAVVALDLSFYGAHVAMHTVPALWRVHRVHHSDPALDVTSTIRQHPLEGLIRYAVMLACACVLGVGLHAFAIYRIASALNGLLEHANIRVPRRVDAVLSLVTTWPNLHKIHHSREPGETDTNYGNLFSWFDRLFGTFTPSSRGETVEVGLDGFDDARTQSTWGLLALPFRTIPAGDVGPATDAPDQVALPGREA
jgi:sterol desaturase/sphingolipid hydroxylase (fatty acid hydroxylase superfamily)